MLEAFYGFVARSVNREYRCKAGNLENLLNILAQTRQCNLAGYFFELLCRREQHSKPRAAYIFEIAAVHEYLCGFFFKKLVENLFEVGGLKER